MMIFNYNRLLKRYDSEVKYYAGRISFEEEEDHGQEIRLHIYRYINNFDPTKASLKYFVHKMIVTAFRRIVYDRRKQRVFEDSFSPLFEDVLGECELEDYDELLSNIIKSLKNDIRVTIFYAMWYNKGEKNYTQISKMLNMNYAFFLNHVKYIKETVKKVVQSYHEH